MMTIGEMFKKEKTIYEMHMDELRDKIFEITKKQNQLSHFGLSEELYSLGRLELQEQKKEMINQMHKLVDEL